MFCFWNYGINTFWWWRNDRYKNLRDITQTSNKGKFQRLKPEFTTRSCSYSSHSALTRLKRKGPGSQVPGPFAFTSLKPL